MTFEKITLFSNDISREFEIFTKLGFECIEQNKAYYIYKGSANTENVEQK